MSGWGSMCGEAEKAMPGSGTEATKQSRRAAAWWGEQAPYGGKERSGPKSKSIAETREEPLAENLRLLMGNTSARSWVPFPLHSPSRNRG